MSNLAALFRWTPMLSSEDKSTASGDNRPTPMKRQLTKKIELREGTFWRQAGKSISINCLQGVVWITQEGSISDNILSEGENFSSLDHGLIVIEALADAKFCVTTA